MITIRESDGTAYTIRYRHGRIKVSRAIDKWSVQTWELEPDIALQIADSIVDAVEYSSYEED
ncbi:hypothetical protein EB73_11500 [Mycobacterium sp. SWH-M3]|nr:hypothetical protein EB73_11500 [Mycobacterium sp. SWH-M3]